MMRLEGESFMDSIITMKTAGKKHSFQSRSQFITFVFPGTREDEVKAEQKDI